MTKQMAINFLDYKAFCLHNDPNVKSDDIEEIINMSINALGKQIAKKPIQPYKTNEIWDWHYDCPICKQIVGIGNIKDKYCNNCGQKIDWGDEDAE